jgi:hypothetical protein
MPRPRHRALAAVAAGASVALCLVLLAGCGSRAARRAGSGPARAALTRYVAAVEPIRLAVNRLLEGADPILEAVHHHRISGVQAAGRMGMLERRFAAYAVDVAAIAPTIPALRSLHAQYAQTYIFEDSYLSALTSGLAHGDLGDLPDTQAAQRAAIIRWRVGLMVLARTLRVALPADLQQAGRGEIRPSPQGS